jgi:molecular chaperone Hsp33
MIVALGAEEAEEILAERGDIEVACEFCGVQYRFDPIDAAQLFTQAMQHVQVGNERH